MVHFWLVLTDRTNWGIIRKKNIYALNSKQKYALLKNDDKLVMYLIPKQIAGIFEVTNLKSNKNVRFKNKQYKFYFDIKPLFIPKTPLLIINKWDDPKIIENISIFKKAKRWGAALYGSSILELTSKDFHFFKNRLKHSNLSE